jgi:hypothetical protein
MLSKKTYHHFLFFHCFISLHGVWGNFLGAADMLSPGVARVNIHTNTKTATYAEPQTASRDFQLRYLHSKLFISDIGPTDRIALYTISGRRISEVQGVSTIPLPVLAQQTMIVCVKRSGKIMMKRIMPVR